MVVMYSSKMGMRPRDRVQRTFGCYFWERSYQQHRPMFLSSDWPEGRFTGSVILVWHGLISNAILGLLYFSLHTHLMPCYKVTSYSFQSCFFFTKGIELKVQSQKHPEHSTLLWSSSWGLQRDRCCLEYLRMTRRCSGMGSPGHRLAGSSWG